jgi:hypothetical protein
MDPSRGRVWNFQGTPFAGAWVSNPVWWRADARLEREHRERDPDGEDGTGTHGSTGMTPGIAPRPTPATRQKQGEGQLVGRVQQQASGKKALNFEGIVPAGRSNDLLIEALARKPYMHPEICKKKTQKLFFLSLG